MKLRESNRFPKKWLPLKTIVPQDVREMVTFFNVRIHGIFDVLMLGKYNTIWHLHEKRLLKLSVTLVLLDSSIIIHSSRYGTVQ